MNRKKELKGLAPINSSTGLSNSITLSQLKKIFVTKDDLESFREDQNDRLDTILESIKSLDKFIQNKKDVQNGGPF